MTLSHRQKLTIIPLLLYWPTIFALTHIPIPKLALRNIYASDKTLHFLGYLVLAFLLWFAISPDRKVNWRRATAWWALLVVAGYGVVDEWLQGYVGRNADVMDFLADLAGALAGLIVLSIFPFWPAALVVTGTAIFVLTNLIQANPVDSLAVISAAFHLSAYGLFSLLWIRYMYELLPVRAPQSKWLIGAFALPTGFLLSIELFSVVAGNDFGLLRVIISAVGIAAVVITIFLTALLHQSLTEKQSPSDT